MKAVQMTLDEDLVAAVDQAVHKLKTTRSAFARDAFRDALAKMQEAELERKHREGYAKRPIQEGEFDGWEEEQQWGDA